MRAGEEVTALTSAPTGPGQRQPPVAANVRVFVCRGKGSIMSRWIESKAQPWLWAGCGASKERTAGKLTDTPQAQAQLARAGGRAKIFVGIAIIVAVVAWLVLSNLGSSSTQYLTVKQLEAQGATDRLVRGMGLVVGDSIEWDPEQLVLRFDLSDESGAVQVVYHGARPDMLKDGAQAVVEGKYVGGGVFEATSLLLKCPSKYTEE
jgi:cytochrome c-type biogenesis protein CcmE